MNMQTEIRQKVLVTGGTGFTGSHLVKRLLARGQDVRVMDNQKGLFYAELESLGAEMVLGSITDQQLVDQSVQGCEVVYHLAAAFRKINASKEEYWDVNVNGTRNLCTAALKYGVKRFVYCSTQGVHGHIDRPPGDETTKIAPADYYQYTKYEGEKVVAEFFEKGLKTTILRPTAIFGPGDPGRWLILFKQASRRRFLMFGSGRTTYHPVYIDNLVDAFELAAEKEAAVGQTYLIGDEHYYTLNEIVTAVGEAIGQQVTIIHLPFWPLWLLAAATELVCLPFKIPPPLFRRRVDWFRQNRGFDISKARRELDYNPQVDFKTGLAHSAKWYRENNFLPAPEGLGAKAGPRITTQGSK